jgi:hypothetical protein
VPSGPQPSAFFVFVGPVVNTIVAARFGDARRHLVVIFMFLIFVPDLHVSGKKPADDEMRRRQDAFIPEGSPSHEKGETCWC